MPPDDHGGGQDYGGGTYARIAARGWDALGHGGALATAAHNFCSNSVCSCMSMFGLWRNIGEVALGLLHEKAYTLLCRICLSGGVLWCVINRRVPACFHAF